MSVSLLALLEQAEAARPLLTRLPGTSVFLLDRELRCRFAAGPATTARGLTAADLEGGSAVELAPPDLRDELVAALEACLAGCEQAFSYARRDLLPHDVHLRPIRDGEGRVDGVLAIVSEASELAAADRDRLALRFRTLFERLPVGAFEAGVDRSCVRVNRAVTDLTGLAEEELLGFGWVRSLHPDDADMVFREWTAAIEERRRFSLEYRLVRPGGEVVTILCDATAILGPDGGATGYIGSIRDVTELRRFERLERERAIRELEEDRVESLASLAGGVAHDFNNLLAVVLNAAELAKSGPDGVTLELLAQIEDAGRRAASLSGLLLDYSGGGVLKTEAVDLAALVRTMMPLLRSAVPAHVCVNAHADVPCVVEADGVRMQQIVLNLVLNAAAAMDDGGTVAIDVSTCPADRDLLDVALGGADLDPGHLVALSVSDSGHGIADEDLGRIFDPFFTTRGDGRGLGLASVRGIARSHGGAVHVATRPGGSTFTVLLPAASRAPDSAERVTDAPAPRRSGAILVVDDEDGVRSLTARILRTRGHETYEAASGAEGLELALGTLELAAIVLDLSMPDLSGAAVVNALRRAGDTTPVVLMSGFAEAHVRDELGDQPVDAVLHKPFTTAQLLSALAGVGAVAEQG